MMCLFYVSRAAAPELYGKICGSFVQITWVHLNLTNDINCLCSGIKPHAQGHMDTLWNSRDKPQILTKSVSTGRSFLLLCYHISFMYAKVLGLAPCFKM